MKKVFAIVLAMVLILAVGVSVLAGPGQFVNSPSNNSAPTIIDVIRENEDCTGEVILTPFNQRNTLPDLEKNMIEKAYSVIANSKDLTTLNGDLADVAAAKKIPGEDLKVSDLFDLRYEGCESHGETHNVTIVLRADTLHRFVGLLHLKHDGEWELIENAKVINNGEDLRFSVSEFSPFAIVVDTSDAEGDSPQTGNITNIAIYGCLMLISAVAIVVLVVKSKKYA